MALAVVGFMLVTSVVSDSSMSFDAFLAFFSVAFLFALIGGLFFGLPMLFLAKELGWTRDRRKMAALGIIIGAGAGLLVTIPIYGSTSQFAYPAEIFPFWIVMGVVAGLVASQVWFILHQSDHTEL